MSPLIYSLLVFTMCIQIAREHVILASMFVLASFLCSSGRMFIVQRQQDCTEENSVSAKRNTGGSLKTFLKLCGLPTSMGTLC